MSGASHPASTIRCLISGTAAAASGRLTVTRTISDPASASSTHWVGRRSRVGGIRQRHRLDDDGRAATHLNAADLHADRFVEFEYRHQDGGPASPAYDRLNFS